MGSTVREKMCVVDTGLWFFVMVALGLRDLREGHGVLRLRLCLSKEAGQAGRDKPCGGSPGQGDSLHFAWIGGPRGLSAFIPS